MKKLIDFFSNNVFSEKIVYFWPVILLSSILIFSAIFRFSWDISSQVVLHIIVLIFLFVILNYYKIELSLKNEGLWLLFFLAALLSAYKSTELSNVRNELFNLFDCLIIGYIASLIPLRIRKKLFYVPVFIGLWLSIILLFYFFKNPANFFVSDKIPYEFLINPNVLAGYLIICLPLSFIFWDKAYPKKDNYSHILLFILIFIGIILTKSRTAILISFFVSGFYLFKYNKEFMKYYKILLIPSLMLLSLFIYLLFSVKGHFFHRISWWHAAVNMFADNFINGVGWGNFGNLYLVYRPSLSLNSLYAHNIFLQMLAEIGLIGTMSFVLIVLRPFQKNIMENNPLNKYLLMAVGCFILYNLFNYSFYIPAIAILFWICIGSTVKNSFTLRSKPILKPWILLILVLVFTYPYTQIFSANVHFQNGIFYMKKEDLQRSSVEMQKSILRDPLPSKYHNKLSEIYFRMFSLDKTKVKVLDKSIDAQKKSIERYSYNAKYWSDLSWLYWISKNKKAAVRSIKTAMEYDTYNQKYPKTLKFFTQKRND
ncbi:O-antigen ligase family protein [Elusimicrobiota bacterium]